MLLNGATATGLTDCCPFVERTYAVDYVDFLGRVGDPAAALADVPREWDYVVDDARSRDPAQLEFAGLRAFYEASHRHFSARLHGVAGGEPPAYRPHCRLRLRLPGDARERARRELGASAVRIAVMPAGSSEPSRYPSAGSWQLILRELAAAFPDATFCLVGRLERDGRTSTSVTPLELERIARSVPRALSCFDRPLLDQLAVVEACAVFVSPHTGFGAAALAVGTPWLALAGGPWHEWLFNSVPFYSVLPDTERYPCYSGLHEPPPPRADDEGLRTPSMTRARITDDLPELVAAAQLLVNRRLSYPDALQRHFPRLLEAYRGDRSRIFSFDAIHEHYI